MVAETVVMDGLTAIKIIRGFEAEGLLGPQRVLALTGNARQEQIDQALEAGMNDGEFLLVKERGKNTAYDVSCYKTLQVTRSYKQDNFGGPCSRLRELLRYDYVRPALVCRGFGIGR